MINPVVGMKVRVVRDIPDWPGGFTETMRNHVGKGKIWTIRSVNMKGGRYRFPQVKLVEDQDDYVWPPECLEEVSPLLSLDKKVGLRSAGKVSGVSSRRDKERPLQARVIVGGHTLALTYREDGRFYPGFDSPIDLVNK